MAGIQSIRSSLDGVVVKFIVVVIIIAFVGSIGWSVFFSSSDANVIAIVDNQEIDINDLNYEMRAQNFYLQERFKDQNFKIDDEMLQKVSIDALIKKSLILNFISDSSLVITDNVAFLELSKDESFKENGRFSLSKFEAMARSQGYIPSTYLKRVKEDIAMSFWSAGIGASSFITDKEINENLRLAEQTRDIDFIRFNLKDILAETNVTQKGVKDFYETNKNLFLTKELVKLKFIGISARDMQKDIEIDEQLIQDEYSDYLENFDNSIRKTVSHLMINVDEKTTLKQAMDLANTVNAKIEEGADFIDLIKEYSDDEGTKNTGGGLGVTDGSMLPPEFEEAIASMKEGDISLPVELEESVHLLKVTDIQEPVPEKYEDKKESILFNLKEDLANIKFIETLDKMSDLAFSLNEINSIGEELNLEVQSAKYFSQDQAPESLNRIQILELLFENEDFRNNPALEVVETSQGEAFILFLEDFLPQSIKTFKEVNLEAEEYYKNELAESKLDLILKRVLQNLNKGSEFSKIAKDQFLELQNYKDISRSSSLLSSSVIFDIFNLPRANIEIAHGSSKLENGDAIVYKLKAVNESQTQITKEDKEAFKTFINSERQTSELAELQVAAQEAAEIIRNF